MAISGTEALAKTLMAEVRRTRDPVARAVLADAQGRAAALAEAAGILAQCAEADWVDITGRLRALVAALMAAHGPQDKVIAVRVEAFGLPLVPGGLAAVMALSAHELVGNALRYAFRQRSGGNLDVCLRQADKRLLLRIEDDGEGISDRTLATGQKGLGLIRDLVEGVGGRFAVTRAVGTTAMVDLPFHPLGSN